MKYTRHEEEQYKIVNQNETAKENTLEHTVEWKEDQNERKQKDGGVCSKHKCRGGKGVGGASLTYCKRIVGGIRARTNATEVSPSCSMWHCR